MQTLLRPRLPTPVAPNAAKGLGLAPGTLEGGLQEQWICPECRLPIGSCWYQDVEQRERIGDGDDEVEDYDGKSTTMKYGQVFHGECKAQLIIKAIKEQEQARLSSERELKKARRIEFDIGWKVERVPDNASLAGHLLGQPVAGLFSLRYDESSRAVHVVPTSDPATAVNLEYLSLALQVRKKEGREPLFSLDPEDDRILTCVALDEEPVDPLSQIKDLMQVKRFEPAWLAGTSVGEVMFQADYHLKELSMGEYEQPVVGMKNCAEFEDNADPDKGWRAREWFVVKKADMFISEGNILVPRVEMGVEARQQVRGKHRGLEDAQITRPDHPLVRYAEAFTHFFDLIAERKSVVYHLRELAKASVLAKYLLDDNFTLDDAWFNLAKAGGDDPHTKIPQLWKAHYSSRIHTSGGEILWAGEGHTVASWLDTADRSVYGGVQFGIDRMKEIPKIQRRLTGVPGEPELRLQSLGQRVLPGRQLGARPMPGGVAAARPTIATARGGLPLRYGMPAARGGLPLGAGIQFKQPRGVDLNLDCFDLSATVLESQAPAGTWGGKDGACLSGDAFWSNLSEDAADSAISKDDKTMLEALFNPHLSDRRAEGKHFVPPDTSPEYVEKLQSLIREEEAVREMRKEHFLSLDFVTEDVGPLFPSSWNTSFAVVRREAAKVAEKASRRQGRIPCEEEAESMIEALRLATPSFDRAAEDGTRYRSYEVGNEEVRTTQELGGKETIGIVYSEAPPDVAAGELDLEGQCLAKVTEYVERLDGEDVPDQTDGMPPHGYFVVIETAAGAEIVTERLGSDKVSWEVAPKDLVARTARAKVIATVDCSEASVSLQDLKQRRDREQKRMRYTGSGSTTCNTYAHAMISLAKPVWEKAWAALTDVQRQAAEKLGVHGENGWNGGSAEVWRDAWADLTAAQREAASELGVNQASWVQLQAPRDATQRRSWDALSVADRRAAQELGVWSAEEWEGAAPEVRQRVLASLWQRTWDQLSEEERQAAGQLDIEDSEAWDSASWEPRGVWAVRLHRLKPKQLEAAATLGLAGPSMWEKALADKLANHWGVTAWSCLSVGQRATASRLGYGRVSWQDAQPRSEH